MAKNILRGLECKCVGSFLVRFPNCILYQSRGWGPWLSPSQLDGHLPVPQTACSSASFTTLSLSIDSFLASSEDLVLDSPGLLVYQRPRHSRRSWRSCGKLENVNWPPIKLVPAFNWSPHAIMVLLFINHKFLQGSSRLKFRTRQCVPSSFGRHF